jgi:protein associated with RNAse G/E
VPAPEIIVKACKYDGTVHRSWPARILRRDGALLVLDAKFDREVQHELLGTIAGGTISTEYYWLDRWYNVFRFAQPSGELRGYYCNINVPPTFDGQVLSYVDLDVDILVEPDLSYRVVDHEDFELNAVRFGYSNDVRLNAEKALNELIGLIESRRFPFSE